MMVYARRIRIDVGIEGNHFILQFYLAHEDDPNAYRRDRVGLVWDLEEAGGNHGNRRRMARLLPGVTFNIV